MLGQITISCPNCPRELRVRREYVGRKVACKFCAALFRIPTHVLIPCPKCGRNGNVRTVHLGRKISCKSCGHSFRARPKRVQGRAPSNTEAARLLAVLARRDAELAQAHALLGEARGQLANLDEEARDLTDGRDVGQRTQVWSIVDDAPSTSGSNLANGTEPDPTRTRIASADPDDPLAALSEERDRLRDELDALREAAERTVVTRDRAQTLEVDLDLARADNVRLAAEREEVGRAVEGLMNLLRERDLALVEAARQRDESRAAFDLAESARLALADELATVRHACEARGLEVPRPSHRDYASAEDSVR